MSTSRAKMYQAPPPIIDRAGQRSYVKLLRGRREEPRNEATQTSMQVNQAQTLPLGAGTRRWIVVEIFFPYMYAAMSILGAARQIISRLRRSYFDVTKYISRA